jgi:hypothetical protein
MRKMLNLVLQGLLKNSFFAGTHDYIAPGMFR